MVKSRRARRSSNIHRKKIKDLKEQTFEEGSVVKEKSSKNFFVRTYEDNYKYLLIIPIVLLLASLIAIGINIAKTGDFINKGVSLKGGLTLTIPVEGVDVAETNDLLLSAYPSMEFSVRSLSEFGVQRGLIIESDLQGTTREEFIDFVEQQLSVEKDSFSVEEMGPSLGEAFFRQTMFAVLLAFIFMGVVVFLYFRTFVPSFAVILSAFSDIIVTIAITNILGMKISTAGIAAFLMLIGYSVDTDILLSARVLKSKEGTIMDRIYRAMKTGLTMNLTTIVAVTIGLIVSQSEVISQIMTIILIGLLVDIINTWIQNVGILRLYLEKKGVK